MKYLFNQRGGKSLVVTAITICVLFLISGGAMIYFTIKDQNIEFSEEVVAEATRGGKKRNLIKPMRLRNNIHLKSVSKQSNRLAIANQRKVNMPSSPLKKNIKKMMNFTLF